MKKIIFILCVVLVVLGYSHERWRKLTYAWANMYFENVKYNQKQDLLLINLICDVSGTDKFQLELQGVSSTTEKNLAEPNGIKAECSPKSERKSWKFIPLKN